MTPSRDTGSALFSILIDSKRAQEYLRRAFGKSLSLEVYRQNVAEIQKAAFLCVSQAIGIAYSEIKRHDKQRDIPKDDFGKGDLTKICNKMRVKKGIS